MVYTLLPDLHPNDHYATICVRVTRKWEYRGVSDDGEPQHVDLVIADHKANVMYAEIPQEMVHAFNNQIQEGEIYEIRRFRVTNAKSLYKPVDGHCMIKFTVHTLVTEPDKPPTTYPRYTYRLTAFEELPMLVGNVQNFIDVLGIIVEISEVEMIQPTNNQPAAPTRKLILMDIRYASERVEIRRVAPAPPQAVQPQHPPQQETRYLRELIAIDPYEFPQGGCRCTVTIARLVPDISWWFPSCVRCGKTCTPDPSGYICHACNNNTYRHKYKLVFVASDGTAEAEMICFGQIGQRIVGKPVEQDPIVIRIDRRQIFNQVAQKLALHVKQEVPLQIKKDDFIAKIEVVATSTNDLFEFYGDFAPTEDEAIQSAYNAAISHYVKKKLIAIDDFNYTPFKKMQSNFLTSQTYLMFSEESETLLENALDFKIQGYKKLASILNDTCKASAEVLPISITRYKAPLDAEENTKITFTGNASSSDPLHKIANSLAEMDEVISFHGYEPRAGDRKGIREYRNKTAWTDYYD
ncbi:unnamed protein product [Urochloa decumbens]|uniref:Replication protein A 70 kDa DNA-binding subunit B/D first OB fold domain-containing protein n=1 Tax=Urochloa decumbens TaxID=240449 RepID=A0ABC8WWW2_9POAL